MCFDLPYPRYREPPVLRICASSEGDDFLLLSIASTFLSRFSPCDRHEQEINKEGFSETTN